MVQRGLAGRAQAMSSAAADGGQFSAYPLTTVDSTASRSSLSLKLRGLEHLQQVADGRLRFAFSHDVLELLSAVPWVHNSSRGNRNAPKLKK